MIFLLVIIKQIKIYNSNKKNKKKSVKPKEKYQYKIIIMI